MFSSVASVIGIAAAVLCAGGPQTRLPAAPPMSPPSLAKSQIQLGNQVQLWNKVQPYLVALDGSGKVSGMAVLIDAKGLFLAHANSAPRSRVLAKTALGTPIFLSLISIDEQTQMVLLECTEKLPSELKVAKVARQEPAKEDLVVASTAAGPFKGQFVVGGLIGNVRPSLRYAPLTEFKCETQGQLGGALIFDVAGDLVGVLGATLETAQDKLNANQARNLGPKIMMGMTAPGGGVGGGGAGRGMGGGRMTGIAGIAPPGFGPISQSANFGPVGLTIGYSLSPEVLRRVVHGFKSASHQVEHPSVGVFFMATEGGRGVLVETVTPGSPADRAGLKTGDVILVVDDLVLTNPVDLAVYLFKQKLGNVLAFRVVQDGVERTIHITVGSQQLER